MDPVGARTGGVRRSRWAGRIANLLLCAGALLLLGPARHFVTGVEAQATASRTPGLEAGRPRKTLAAGDAVGRLEIPRVGLDLAVFEGVSAPVLRKGPGHMPGTACPGLSSEPGNCVIAGHRDSFFRRLVHAREGDVVRFRSGSSDRSYRLAVRRIVAPENVDSLAPTSRDRLTLITCYPFDWAGSAPYRLVWEASPLPPSTASVSTALRPASRIPGPSDSGR